MKKIILLLCMVAGLLSCAKEALTPQDANTPYGTPISFRINVVETKSEKTAWVGGDKIYVFFNGLATKYLQLEYSGSSWSCTFPAGDIFDTDLSGLGTKTLTAVHFPVSVDVAYDDVDNKFSFTSGGNPVYNFYLHDTNEGYTLSGSTLTASITMGKPANMVQIHVADIESSVNNYYFCCSKIKPVACMSVGLDGTITEDVKDAGIILSGIADDDGGIFAGRLTNPDESTDYTFTLVSVTDVYTLARADKSLNAGKMYNFPAPTVTGNTDWNVVAVNLGFKVGGKTIYWAKCNVGAATETDYGNYYSWGNTVTQTEYNWAQYPYGSGKKALTKYNTTTGCGTVDNITTLELSDDVAYTTMGKYFRMPTNDELVALCNTSNTNQAWMSNFNSSSKNGWKMTNKSNSSKYIFLPAAGYYYSGTFGKDDTVLTNAGSYCWYWSSTLYTSTTSKAYALVGASNAINANDTNSRFEGRSVRPVFVIE